MELGPGKKLHSAVCDAQVIVIRAPAIDIELRCGGVPLLEDGQEPDWAAVLDETLGEGPLLGKRYADEELGLEVLCTRPGRGR
jgi:hypothetical protein